MVKRDQIYYLILFKILLIKFLKYTSIKQFIARGELKSCISFKIKIFKNLY